MRLKDILNRINDYIRAEYPTADTNGFAEIFFVGQTEQNEILHVPKKDDSGMHFEIAQPSLSRLSNLYSYWFVPTEQNISYSGGVLKQDTTLELYVWRKLDSSEYFDFHEYIDTFAFKLARFIKHHGLPINLVSIEHNAMNYDPLHKYSVEMQSSNVFPHVAFMLRFESITNVKPLECY